MNERIDLDTQLRIRSYVSGEDGRLSSRIGELRREWDFERVLEAESAAMGVLGIVLGALSPRMLVLPGFVASMILTHALNGCYPLLPLFRRIGIRTQDEIDRELYALKALRGDFDGVSGGEAEARAHAAWQAVCA
jgi:hypothetical protein